MRDPIQKLFLLAPIALALGAGATTLDRVTASPDVHLDLAPPLVADHEVAVQTVGGSAVLLDLGVLPEAVDVTGYHRENSLSHLFSVDLPCTIGGLAVEPRDVVRVDLSGPSPVYSLAFDGSAAGVPWGVEIDAVSFAGTRVLVSFDVHLGGFGPEDLLYPGGGGFNAFFDGSAAGVPAGMDLDGAYYLATTDRLFLSFDVGGEVGGFAIADDDVIEWNPAAESWVDVPWRGSDEDGGWVASDLDALAVVPFDNRPPDNPTDLVSTSHTLNTWSRDSTVDFQWQGAAEVGVSGLDGYSVLVDTRSASVPDDEIDQAHGHDPQAFTSAALADGDGWYFHLRSCDQAGNCAAALHLGPFWIDTQPPGSATALQSTSHTVGEPSADTTVEMSWSAAVDGLSGVAGYGSTFRTSSTRYCTRSANLGAGATTTVSPSLAEGSWWFHLCAVDAAGNWGPVAAVGPFVVDATAPTVVLAHTVADTGDGVLSPGEVTGEPISQLSLRFSETVADPPDHTTPGDVSNPDSYRVIGAGPDGVVSTADCGVSVGDDIEHTVSYVSFGDPVRTANLYVGSVDALAPGPYRLIGCAPGGVHDAAGNELDGDGDGTGGDAFLLDFRVSDEQLTVAPTFDDELADWTLTGSGLQWDQEDAGGWPTSGSAWVYASPDALQGLSQCVPVSGELYYRLKARILVWSGDPSSPTVWAEAEPFTSSDCTTGSLGTATTAPVVGYDVGLQWQTRERWVGMPAGAQSARVSFLVDEGTAASYDVFLDDLQLRGAGAFFADGFESGDGSAWSSASP